MGTLGENLKKIREEAGISLAELAKKTKIQEKYLKRLEKEEFDTLPSTVYIKGFIKKWTSVCGKDSKEFLLQFYRENEELIKENPKERLGSVFHPTLVITTKHIVITIIVLVVALLSGFFYFNNKAINQIPKIEILQPVDFNSATEEDSVLIVGVVQNVQNMYINGEQIYYDESGTFEYKYNLTTGLNTITIKAIGASYKEIETARKVLKL